MLPPSQSLSGSARIGWHDRRSPLPAMTSTPQRQLALNIFIQRWGHFPEAWKHPSHRPISARPNPQFYLDLARLAEAGRFDTFFVADFIGRSGDDIDGLSRRGHSYQFEPFTLLGAVAAVTRHIGLVATVNTNFTEPYNLARQFTSLDHLSGGRAGWNIVSSYGEATAKNFGHAASLEHGERYERAAEYVDLVRAYWDSYDDDAFDAPEPAIGRFFDPRKAHLVNHHGKYLQAHGLLDLPRPIQGHPVFVQAGNSDTGREFAARFAEMTYASATSLDVAQEYYRDIKRRMPAYGRAPDQLKITPGLSVIVGESDQQAKDLYAGLQELTDFSRVELAGVDLTGHDLDGPLPDLQVPAGGRGRFQQLVELAKRENLTIRQLVLRFSQSRGHLQVHGSAKTVADVIERWFVEGGADGFNVVPPLPPLQPGGFITFVEKVVPELQRRGLFRREYTGATFREHLGLDRPADKATRARSIQATA
jgi:FMN-dependent oxidoreductase (nitrilotriacetate monooxygenase family)